MAPPSALPCGRIEVDGIAVYTGWPRPGCPSLSETLSDGEDERLGDAELVFSMPPLSAKKASLTPPRGRSSEEGGASAPALCNLISFDDIAASLAGGERWLPGERRFEDGCYVPTASLPFAARLALIDGRPSGLRGWRGRHRSCGGGGGGPGSRAPAPVARSFVAECPAPTALVHSSGPGRAAQGPAARPARAGWDPEADEEDEDEDAPWAGFRESSPGPRAAPMPLPRGDHAPRPPRADDSPPSQRPPAPPRLPSLGSFDEPSLPLASSPRVLETASFMDRVPNERGGAAFPLPSSAAATTSCVRSTVTAFRPKASVCHALDERALDDECHDDREWFTRRPPRCSMLATLCGSTGEHPSAHGGANGAAPRCDEMHTGIAWPPCGPVEQLRVRVRL